MFKDNIGMSEELIVEMVDCTPHITVTREWLEGLTVKLRSITTISADEILLDAIIQDINSKLIQ